MEGIKKALVAAPALVLLAAAWAAANPVALPLHPEPAETGGFDVGSGKPFATIFVVLAAIAVIAVIAAAALGYLRKITAKSLREVTPVSFAAEEVHITLTEAGAKVSGLYTFHNPYATDKTVRLAYPFAEDAGIGEPEYIIVEDDRGEMLPFDMKYGILTFKTRVPASGDAVVRVAFEQSCRADKFRYILTTTREWKRPLEYAHFIVEAPAAFGPLESNYPLTRASTNGEVTRYELYRENFWPEEDLIITWRKAGDAADVPAAESGEDVGARGPAGREPVSAPAAGS